MATINLGRVKLVNRGTWSSANTYAIDDFVQFTDNGVVSTYIAVAASTNQTPSTSGTENSNFWKFLAKGVAIAVGNNKVVTSDASGNLQGTSIGSAGQVLKVNSSANGFEFGAGSDVVGRAAYQNSTRTSFGQVTTQDNEFWSFTYNRQSSTSDIIISAIMPMCGDKNWPDIGDFVKINTFRTQRGVYHAGRGGSVTSPWSFLCIGRYTASEIGSTTGNITIAFGWNRGATASTGLCPADVWNPNSVDDGRVSGSQTISQAIITEVV